MSRHVAFALAVALAGCHHGTAGSRTTTPQPDFVLRTLHQTPAAVTAQVAAATTHHPISATEWVFFKTGSEQLSVQAQQDLEAVAAWLRAHPDEHILVEGHTDSVGLPAFNMRLSFRRAVAVADYLAARGVARERIGIDPQGALHAARNPRASDRHVILFATVPGETGIR